jgi:hypothetical protein
VKRLAVSLAVIVVCVPLGVAPAGAAVRHIEAPTPGFFELPLSTAQVEEAEGTVQHPAAFRAAQVQADYWGGARTAADGETVNVYASDDLPDDATDDAALQAIADFLVTLPHGDELQALNVFVVSTDEMQSTCGQDALACYTTSSSGGGIMIMPSSWPVGYPGQEVVTHEYGHHIAENRDNAPWQAIDWGPKRWATAMNICSRVAAGTAFPGDEGQHYYSNPGEAWAENYRIAVWGSRATLGLNVDSSFTPTPAALAAALEDVTDPWVQAPPTLLSGSLVAPKPVAKHVVVKKKAKKKKKKPAVKRRLASLQLLPAKTFSVSTPLDGTLNVQLLSGPPGLTVSVVDAVTHKVLSPPNIGATATLCGSRAVTVVVDGPSAGAFKLALSAP